MSVERHTPSSGEPAISEDMRGVSCPRCDHSFPSTDEMLDHLSSHLRQDRSGQDFAAGPSIFLSTMPAWQVDAALSDLESSLRGPAQHRLVRAMLTYAVVTVMVLAAVVLLVAGHPVLGVVSAVSAVLLADGRPVRYLGKVSRSHRGGTGAE
jgi:hypothetical protein